VLMIHVGRLDVPSGSLVDDAVVVAFVASAGSGTKGMTGDILLLDALGGVAIDWGDGGGPLGGGSSVGTLRPGVTRFVGSCHGSVERGQVPHHAFVLLLLVSVDGLSMLAKVIQTRELFAAMASKGPFASMFSDVPCKMLTSAKDHAAFAIATALEGLCRCRTIALAHAGDASANAWGVMSDEGGRHISW
jgi:hypothetical protein